MKLLRFRITNFRSVEDSGWIAAYKITSLIGVNESGKTNLLIPLWKLNPNTEGQIDPIKDYPRKLYNQIKKADFKPIFVSADFEVEDQLVEKLNQETSLGKQNLKVIRVSRNLAGEYFISLPEAEASEEENTIEIYKLPKQNLPLKAEFQELILEQIPHFVYYSHYGNLDSEIYLPQIIENLKREKLSSKEEAKVRTLKVLFDFVKLKPEEILELGCENSSAEEVAERKKERDILLQAASASLTQSFEQWWKQGNYRFRFQADGDHFRIWVSDSKRTEDIELESRSTGLQWFLSFYLIFLSERNTELKGAILLLDEPGISLHPLAQKDLLDFFENLSETNQIVFTTHSPFLIDPSHLERVKAVYVGENGNTCLAQNLKINDYNSLQAKSIYPIQTALGLNIINSLLHGSQIVLVKSLVEQYYLNAIKTNLIGEGMIRPRKEIIFLPMGDNQKAVSSLIELISSGTDELPYIVLNSSSEDLGQNIYAQKTDRLVSLAEIRGFAEADIEDLFSNRFIADLISRAFRGPEEDFIDLVKDNQPILPQVIKYAQDFQIDLPIDWRLKIAKQIKNRLLKSPKSNSEMVEKWRKLFLQIEL